MRNSVSIPYSTIKSRKSAQINVSLLRFQFLIVQLKVSTPDRQYGLTTFQFLIVQLKESFPRIFDKRTKMFQFLIVQLKVLQLRMQQCLQKVSIPYSTIKSVKALGANSVNAVSIPYSTIKRSTPLTHLSILLGFNSL